MERVTGGGLQLVAGWLQEGECAALGAGWGSREATGGMRKGQSHELSRCVRCARESNTTGRRGEAHQKLIDTWFWHAPGGEPPRAIHVH